MVVVDPVERFGLEQRAHLAERPAQVAVALTADPDPPGVRPVKTHDHAHRGRLPGAVGIYSGVASLVRLGVDVGWSVGGVISGHTRHMTAWVTLADIGTAAGTLVLAGATFVAVRAAARSTQIAERTLLVGPSCLMPSDAW